MLLPENFAPHFSHTHTAPSLLLGRTGPWGEGIQCSTVQYSTVLHVPRRIISDGPLRLGPSKLCEAQLSYLTFVAGHGTAVAAQVCRVTAPLTSATIHYHQPPEVRGVFWFSDIYFISIVSTSPLLPACHVLGGGEVLLPDLQSVDSK